MAQLNVIEECSLMIWETKIDNWKLRRYQVIETVEKTEYNWKMSKKYEFHILVNYSKIFIIYKNTQNIKYKYKQVKYSKVIR